MTTRISRLGAVTVLITAILGPGIAAADNWAMPGDLALRHDIQLLADAGVIGSPVTTWPIPWPTIEADLAGHDGDASTSPAAQAAERRVRARLARATRKDFAANARLGTRTDDFWLRTFEDTPREPGEMAGGISWMGERFAVRLQGSYVPDPERDDDEWRADGSYVAVTLGNHILSLGTTDRWWGPGWDNTLVLSSNPRPIPAITLERRVAKPFETKWLSWIGPWNYTFFWGRMEHDRAIPRARLTGLRLTVRPLDGLELGVTRTAMWCGEGRPCGLDTFWDVIAGNDNRGQSGVTQDNEPGDQMGGFDARWASPVGDLPYAVYTQWIGEDEEQKHPSQWFAQAGIEIWGRGETAWRAHLEWANTTSDFAKKDTVYDVVYNHAVYQTGHRYKGRAIGAAVDGDSQVLSAGFTLVTDGGASWNALVHRAVINNKGNGEGRDAVHSVASAQTTRMGAQLSHRRELEFGGNWLGHLSLGVGVERLENRVTGESSTDLQAFAQWTWDQGL